MNSQYWTWVGGFWVVNSCTAPSISGAPWAQRGPEEPRGAQCHPHFFREKFFCFDFLSLLEFSFVRVYSCKYSLFHPGPRWSSPGWVVLLLGFSHPCTSVSLLWFCLLGICPFFLSSWFIKPMFCLFYFIFPKNHFLAMFTIIIDNVTIIDKETKQSFVI